MPRKERFPGSEWRCCPETHTQVPKVGALSERRSYQAVSHRVGCGAEDGHLRLGSLASCQQLGIWAWWQVIACTAAVMDFGDPSWKFMLLTGGGRHDSDRNIVSSERQTRKQTRCRSSASRVKNRPKRQQPVAFEIESVADAVALAVRDALLQWREGHEWQGFGLRLQRQRRLQDQHERKA